MNNQSLMRGLALVAIALLFGIPAATYQVGTFSHAGPGLFPLLVASLVGLVGAVTIVRARFEAAQPMRFDARNLLIVLGSLVGFVLIAQTLKAIAAIVFVVYFSTLAGQTYSWRRNARISAVLVAIAFAFHHFLGLGLPLY